MLLDVGLVVLVGSAISISISAATEPGSRDPDALAYSLGLMMAALLLARRRWPVGTLMATLAVFTLYTNLDYPGFVPAVPLAVPLYSAAVAGGLAWSLGVSVLEVAGPLLYRLLVGSEPVARVINDSLRDSAFFAAIVLLGVVVRSRRAYAAEVAERLRRAEAESERVAQELKVARLVQQQFLPAELPDLPGWRIAAFYRSAREVGGDFYSFSELPTGRMGIAIGDVTDKGAPAALVMAT
ncbi:MAG: PP2C family protein-serine/threonine phosphatase, partial [Actinomycetota bacterium]